MSGKLDGISERQARGGVQSECKLPRAKRLPFADITNVYNSRTGQHEEPSPAPSQSRTLSRVAMQIERGSDIPDSAVVRNFLGETAAETVAPLRDRRAVQASLPPLSSYSGLPSRLESTRSSPPVKPVSGAPSLPLPGSVPHPRGDSLRSKPSRRQLSLGSGTLTQCLHDPDLCGDPINNVSLYDAPDVKLLLQSCPRPSSREPLSTSLLPLKTHKLAYGQLAILPSRSVLVDFREGERRTGRKGDEVMVVSPNGHQIYLFSAPHLSTPCCLAEPIATHSLDELPADRYKLYEQAKKVIEHLKRNVPKVVMYEGTFVCTLMANEPRADIEIRTNLRSTTAVISATATSTIRIRFSRKLRTMQIFSSEPTVCKKTMFCTARGVPADAEDWALLSKNEKECLAALLDFLRVVEAVEGLPRGTSKPLCAVTVSAERLPKSSTRREAAHPVPSAEFPRRKSEAYPPGTGLLKPAATPTSTIPLPAATALPPSSASSHITISPRPRFPSTLPRTTTTTSGDTETFRKASSRTAVSDAMPPPPPPPPRPPGDAPSSSSSLATRAEASEESDRAGSLRDLDLRLTGGGSRLLQTRFMPGVGWCVRSGGTRYRIMFADGVALEVDVDEERVEMVERDGSVVRCTVRECGASRKVGDRIKVFREFLALFDESDS